MQELACQRQCCAASPTVWVVGFRSASPPPLTPPNKTMSNDPLRHLDPQIVPKLLEYLPAESIWQVATVSKGWRAAVLNDETGLGCRRVYERALNHLNNRYAPPPFTVVVPLTTHYSVGVFAATRGGVDTQVFNWAVCPPRRHGERGIHGSPQALRGPVWQAYRTRCAKEAVHRQLLSKRRRTSTDHPLIKIRPEYRISFG